MPLAALGVASMVVAVAVLGAVVDAVVDRARATATADLVVARG